MIPYIYLIRIAKMRMTMYLVNCNAYSLNLYFQIKFLNVECSANAKSVIKCSLKKDSLSAKQQRYLNAKKRKYNYAKKKKRKKKDMQLKRDMRIKKNLQNSIKKC